MRTQSRNSLCQQQRGAIGLVGLLTLLTAILFTALAVDSGRLWMQQRKLQSIADIAAISAARQMGCIPDSSEVVSMAQFAAANNGFQGQLSQAPNQVLVGSVASNAGVREFTPDIDNAEAVYVRATQDVPSSLVAGGLFGDMMTLTAEAVSVSDPLLAAFNAGSFTLALNSEDAGLLNALLGEILGSPLNLNVLTYEGIASTKISLQDMLQASGEFGSVEALLAADMQIGELLALFANAASQSGVANLQAAAAMQTIASLAVENVSLRLSDVLAVSTPDENTAATVGLNALSLITTAAIVSNGQNALTVPLAINLPTISSINAQMTFIEPPQMAIGPAAGDGDICTMVRTAQVRTRVAVLTEIPLLARIDLALGIEVAQGTAGLRSIEQNSNESAVQIEAQPGIALTSLSNNAGTGPARISTLALPLLPSIPIADIVLNLPVQPADMQVIDFNIANPIDDHLSQTQTVVSPLGSSMENALSQPEALDVTVLSALNLGLVNTVIATVISPLLGEIGRVFLDPLLGLLGIQLGGMDITLDDIQYRQSKPLVI